MVKKAKLMNTQTFLTEWIAASNAFDTDKYLDFYLPEAILDDPSVGRTFERRKGIKQYFDNYFIGYNTHTEQVELKVINKEHAHLKVQFTGDFPEGKIAGTFDFKFRDNKIVFVTANLIH